MNTGSQNTGFIQSKIISGTTDIEEIANGHPLSSYAQFLLLANYKINNNPSYEQLKIHNALYFNNQHWIQFQLDRLTNIKNETPSNDTPEPEGHFAVIVPTTSSDNQVNGVDDEIAASDRTQSNDTQIINDPVNEAGGGLTELQEGIEPGLPEENMVDNQHQLPTEKLDAQASEINENDSDEAIGFEEAQANDTENVNEEENNTDGLQEEDSLPPAYQQEKIAEEKVEEKLAQTELNPTEVTSESTQPQAMEEKPSEELSFEPLHTIDYFASQGIKINEDDLPDDKLGKQMRSFTDWLKSMKKLHPGKLPEQNEIIEQLTQHSAEQSNTDAKILTEAMAEVLIKQSKLEKAVEMYEKLSLMNPSKSAYFAAKIESIKNL